MNKSKILYENKLNSFFKFNQNVENFVLIYDSKLNKKFGKFIHQFPNRIKVEAGETLKTLDSFNKVTEQLFKKSQNISKKELTLVSLGGGSVGDFTGFLASVYKRGVNLIHIPSTWLSALDSAHGGKTALNLLSAKNQIGTFYQASLIFVCKELLYSQNQDRIVETSGEIIKTILISGKVNKFLKKKLNTINLVFSQKDEKVCENYSLTLKKKINSILSNEVVWSILPELISYKYKIVQSDPYEHKGKRHILNFGHTVGHIIEAQLNIPHGMAVGYGIRFSIELAKKLKLYRSNNKIEKDMLELIPSVNELTLQLKKIKDFKLLLLTDKKLSSDMKIKFIFISRMGHPFVKEIQIDDIIKEWKSF